MKYGGLDICPFCSDYGYSPIYVFHTEKIVTNLECPFRNVYPRAFFYKMLFMLPCFLYVRRNYVGIFLVLSLSEISLCMYEQMNKYHEVLFSSEIPTLKNVLNKFVYSIYALVNIQS